MWKKLVNWFTDCTINNSGYVVVDAVIYLIYLFRYVRQFPSRFGIALRLGQPAAFDFYKIAHSLLFFSFLFFTPLAAQDFLCPPTPLPLLGRLLCKHLRFVPRVLHPLPSQLAPCHHDSLACFGECTHARTHRCIADDSIISDHASVAKLHYSIRYYKLINSPEF